MHAMERSFFSDSSPDREGDGESRPFLLGNLMGKVGLIPIEGVFWDSMLKKF